ncbi:MAG: hypothetical protein HZB19_05795 [Chloroflexi bacterium]|nr:hypothetical protein [Chloroflexota bacterium]
MKLSERMWFVILTIALLLTACGAETAPTEPGVDAMMTSGVGTMVASFFETQTAMVTPATETPTPTLTPFPTITPFVSPTPLVQPTATYIYYAPTLGTVTALTPIATGTYVTATTDPGSLGSGCNNLAFIRDVTIPSGAELAPQENFNKVWKVQNIGTCEWLYVYSLVLVSGESFDAPPTRLGKVVAVGEWTEISINMDAPKHPGTYTSYWRLADGDGNMFGAALEVSIVVK